MKLQPILEGILREEEDKKQIAAMNQVMGDTFKALGAEFQANKDEIEQEVEKTQAKLDEAIGAIAIIGFILALPKVVELFAKGFGKLVALWKKLVKPGEAKGQEKEFASNIIEFTHKWHSSYIKGLKFILKISGIYKKAGITDDGAQTKAAEVVYYIIVAGLAVYAGVGAIGAFKSALQGSSAASNFSIGAFEIAMASIKSGEVVDFIAKLGLKAV